MWDRRQEEEERLARARIARREDEQTSRGMDGIFALEEERRREWEQEPRERGM